MAEQTVPQTIDRYTILGQLGSGGMGVVYRADDPGLGRPVAIKVLPRELATDPTARQRFLDEARNAARLTHDNILPVYDVGETADGPYFVMQYVEGQDLRQRIGERGRLSEAEAMPLLWQLAKAVDYAHQQGVCHRDIKPDNVMLTAGGKALLMDFGIARAADGVGRGLTQTGMMVGTPEYMSPEQAMGQPVDARSDLYSLAVVAFAMFTGQAPYAGTTPVQVAVAHVNEPPPPPSLFVPELPAAWDAIFARAMAKAPEHRYGSASEFVAALEQRAQPAAPPPMQRPSTAASPPTKPARSMPILAALAALGCLLGVGLVLFAVSGMSPRSAPVESRQPPVDHQSGADRPGQPEQPAAPAASVPVPNVVGSSSTQARATLEQAGLHVGAVGKEPNPAVAAGYVISQVPAAGDSARPGDAVALVLSKGVEYYIIPDSDRRALTFHEVMELSPAKRRLAKNEIYARHGYIFQTPEMKAYFTSQSWYDPDPSYSDSRLSDVENDNIDLLAKNENTLYSGSSW